MNSRGQRAVLVSTLIFTLLYMAFAGWLFVNKETPTTVLTLNEWGDFLAGICGPLALIWVITSVIMQGMELSEQRAEMAKQAKALETQASYIERELRREEEDKCWR
ncbi:hypothetical protein [Brucella anthropi]|uniref:hypothetical protein n=1 Tax=Brucella anthropi TaxID=529 RepID=UPI0004ED8B35|nr:hypothetical protein [Brucella anthropi]AIK41020.1 hypothetical protein DR92_4622 [Brucella anthropi]KAB2727521.1 hypothetical protein F9K90_23085 [Brucella anthropi]KAB2743501.1 hypothetical protein F9K95_23625 [Brucella anthropi]KAB2774009.1 hypothetical protein F9K99_23895 [Brucella anthropi]NKC49968.1 hypothetical protein [Brucella anthropi ATCC 49188]